MTYTCRHNHLKNKTIEPLFSKHRGFQIMFLTKKKPFKLFVLKYVSFTILVLFLYLTTNLDNKMNLGVNTRDQFYSNTCKGRVLHSINFS